jgi:glycosyltransferase involved in cell wall biosynthesis
MTTGAAKDTAQPPLRISVAMATYNGAAHIDQQLESMLGQTRKPDELVVTDDGSTDGTPELVEAFAAKVPFEVRVIRNEKNLRVAKNFGKAIGLCSGDIIVLADQDDAWLGGKLQRIEREFADPEVGLVFSDATVVDQELRPMGYNLWDSIHLRGRRLKMLRRERALEAMLGQYIVTGATAAFRADLRDVVLPIADGWIHDGWIALLAAACAKVVAIEEPLILYRQHTAQQIGAPRLTFKRLLDAAMALEWGPHCSRERDNYAAALERLSEHRRKLRDERTLAWLGQKVRHCDARARAHLGGRWRRPGIVARELLSGRYFRYSSFPIKAAGVDLLL